MLSVLGPPLAASHRTKEGAIWKCVGVAAEYSWACCIRVKRKCGQCNEEMRFDATDKDSSIRDVHLEDAELSIREVHSGKSHRIAAPCVRVQYQ